jgi:hypothetical protein
MRNSRFVQSLSPSSHTVVDRITFQQTRGIRKGACEQGLSDNRRVIRLPGTARRPNATDSPYAAGRLNLLRFLQELSTVLRRKRLGFLHELLLLILIELGRSRGARRHRDAHLLKELLLSGRRANT